MANTTPGTAFGTTLDWNAHDVGYIKSISGPSIKADVVDVSTNDSANGYREYIAGLRDGGDVSIDVEFIPGDTTGQTAFLTDLHTGTARQVIITLPDDTTWIFNAIATGFEPSFPDDGSLLASLSMKVTGKPVYSQT